jgi:hypothetical protein
MVCCIWEQEQAGRMVIPAMVGQRQLLQDCALLAFLVDRSFTLTMITCRKCGAGCVDGHPRHGGKRPLRFVAARSTLPPLRFVTARSILPPIPSYPTRWRCASFSSLGPADPRATTAIRLLLRLLLLRWSAGWHGWWWLSLVFASFLSNQKMSIFPALSILG